MSKQFTPCPACGAVGEVGSVCQFCGTTVILKEGATFSDTRIIAQRTITPQQYAERISIYHNVEGLCDGVSKVSIGEQEGIVNLNGDLVYPLGNERISKGFKDGVVKIGKKYLNLETFEYVEDPYLNKTVLEKIEKISETLMNEPSLEAFIDFKDSIRLCTTYCLKSWATFIDIIEGEEDCPDELMSSQLAVYFNGYDLEGNEAQIAAYKKFASCKHFKLFTSVSDVYPDGDIVPLEIRPYYILCGHDIEYSCKILLQVLHQIYNIHPNNAAEHMKCYGDIFEEDDEWRDSDNSSNINNSNYTNDSSNISNSSNTNTSNSGCAGMLALILGVGGAGIYGLVELISKLIA